MCKKICPFNENCSKVYESKKCESKRRSTEDKCKTGEDVRPVTPVKKK